MQGGVGSQRLPADIARPPISIAILRTLRADAALRSSPAVWRLYSVGLRGAGHQEDARRELADLVKTFPADCESRATLAGFRLDQKQTAEARQLAEPIIARARDESATPADVRCGLVAAAAVGDATRAASLLYLVASREDLLRYWAGGRDPIGRDRLDGAQRGRPIRGTRSSTTRRSPQPRSGWARRTRESATRRAACSPGCWKVVRKLTSSGRSKDRRYPHRFSRLLTDRRTSTQRTRLGAQRLGAH